MILINGYKVAKEILQPARREILDLKKRDIIPFLAIIMAGDDKESSIYIGEKAKKAKEFGVKTQIFRLKSKTTTAELKKIITKLNYDKKISGILVQLPLPKQINIDEILNTILPEKEVDGITPTSPYSPACATGIMKILAYYKIDPKEKKVVIVGRGRIVGRPLFVLMQKAAAHVVCISPKDENLVKLLNGADIVVGAANLRDFIKKDMIKKGAVVIDAAKNVNNDVAEVARYLTPRIGGVGPVTVAMLLKNVVDAARVLTNF